VIYIVFVIHTILTYVYAYLDGDTY